MSFGCTRQHDYHRGYCQWRVSISEYDLAQTLVRFSQLGEMRMGRNVTERAFAPGPGVTIDPADMMTIATLRTWQHCS